MTEARQPTRVALVGSGYIAAYHVVAARQAGAEVVGVVDVDKAAAAAFAKAHSIPVWSTSIDEVVRRSGAQVAHVLTPPDLHLNVALEAMAHGLDVLLEKPATIGVDECDELRGAASSQGRVVGVGHNFLFTRDVEQLSMAMQRGDLGVIEHVEVAWRKPLGQLRNGPYRTWMLRAPGNIAFEVGSHLFAAVASLFDDLVIDDVDVASTKVLPTGVEFHRRWQIRGHAGDTTLLLRMNFSEGLSEHYLHVHGSQATALVDHERNAVTTIGRGFQNLDTERLRQSLTAAGRWAAAGVGTFASVVAEKAGVGGAAAPYQSSITGAVEAFHRTRTTGLDPRLGLDLAARVAALSEAAVACLPAPVEHPAAPRPASGATAQPVADGPCVLVLGGTGFIGIELVRQLVAAGARVRVVARTPAKASAFPESVEVVGGNLSDAASLESALHGIEVVYDLARGEGSTWDEYEQSDVLPTVRLAELAAAAGVRRFVYTSSIAVYDARDGDEVITESTSLSDAMAASSPYSRSKVENERRLRQVSERTGLNLVIVRPGVVLGEGGDPQHWGVASWVHPSACILYGTGTNPLPIVLVEDVADALVRMLDAPGIDDQSFNLAGPPLVSARQYLDALGEATGQPIARRARRPEVYFAGSLAKWAVKRLGDPAASRPTFADCAGRSLAARFDCSHASDVLGWSPTADRDEILERGIRAPGRKWNG